jgi:hypothetical protein
MGASELFLFEVENVITKIDFERSKFYSLDRRTYMEESGKISGDMFIDTCLLTGSTFLPTFPPLANISQKHFTIRDAANMLLTLGRSVTALCSHYQDEPLVQQLNYLDRYRRAKMAVKHHVVFRENGVAQPLDVDHAPSDIHEFIGQRLPDELYFYLSRGIVGPRVPNWLTSGELTEGPPLDSSESGEYQRLVREKLDKNRMQALALLSQPLSRFYHRKDIVMHFWFNKDAQKKLSFKDLLPAPREIVATWNVKEEALKSVGGTSAVSSFLCVKCHDFIRISVLTSYFRSFRHWELYPTPFVPSRIHGLRQKLRSRGVRHR